MIRLILHDGTRHALRWTDRHPMSRYGLGVVMHARQGVPIDGAQFKALAERGARIECSNDVERRRVAGALAWAALALPDSALVLAPVSEDQE